MSSHVRQQIREAVVTELKKITAFGNRVYPYFTKAAPATPQVRVRTWEEKMIQEKRVFGATGPVNYRGIVLEIEVRDKASSDLDDRMDGYAASIEKKMDGTFLDSLAVSAIPDETTIEMSDAEQDVALMTMTWLVDYRTVNGAPETAVL